MERLIALLWRSPARVVVLSFACTALVGAALLMLPFATVPGISLTFLDALFTAVSAVCVTGLIVVDTPETFALFGRIVILMLIQIGGLGIMAFSLASVTLIRQRLTASEAELLSFMLNQRNRARVKSQLNEVFIYTIMFELIGAVILTLAMRRHAGSLLEAFGLGLFHAVSAFCNAGFALFSDSLEQFSASFAVNMTVIVLIIAGGIGFSTMILFEEEVGVLLRRRGKRGTPPGRLFRRSAATRTAVSGTVALVAIGCVLVYLFEARGVLAERSLSEKYLAALFQSVTLRTAGFNTVPFGSLALSTVLIMIPFMFVGGASGGTAGGIKIGTIAVLIADFRRHLRGDRDASLFGRRIDRKVVSQAMVLVIAGISVAFLATIVLSVSETAPFESLLFEVVSAIGTVGLSVGITGALSPIGRLVIIALMFIGRLGPLTLLTAIQPPSGHRELRYPESDIVVG